MDVVMNDVRLLVKKELAAANKKVSDVCQCPRGLGGDPGRAARSERRPLYAGTVS